MAAGTRKSVFGWACLLWGAAAGLFFLPERFALPVQTTLRDAVEPGRRAAAMLLQRAVPMLRIPPPRSVDRTEIESLRAELDHWRLEWRRTRLKNAQLAEEMARLQRQRTGPYLPTAGQPLVIPELIEATVLRPGAAGAWRSGRMIDRGAAHTIAESNLVLQSSAPLIDQGADADLETDQPVYAGRTVVGKIAAAGQWTSALQLVTDAGYRGYAQLAHGETWGAEGILIGQGTDLCKLANIPVTESVEVGDLVYTARNDGWLAHPMFYGTVIAANADSHFWEILVKPAVNEIDLTKVQVLTERLNPLRVSTR